MNTQGMSGEGYLAPWARGTDMKKVGPMPQVKHTIFTTEEIAQLDALIKKNLNELFNPI